MSRRIAVHGLGYVGLPLIRACINNGDLVVGFDVSPAVVDGLRRGQSHVDDVTDAEVGSWLDAGFLPTTDPADLGVADVFVICVPTPLSKDGGPDLSAVEAAARTIRDHVRPGALVVLESTSYPGTTDEVVRPIIEASGLVAGEDFNLAFSPERIDPGNKDFNFENTPKVVGGYTSDCASAAELFYAPLTVRVVRTKGLKEAEMAKLLENTYRHVNIALVNELSKLSHAMGIDIWDVIDAAASKPYGFQAFTPGPGVGGHCIPIDPNYLSHRVKSELGQPFRFVELAQEINHSMPDYVVERVQEILNADGKSLKGSSVVLLGVTYKKDIADTRETPAVPLAHRLMQMGAEVSFHDPLVSEFTVDGRALPFADIAGAVTTSDVAILLQDHHEYAELLQAFSPRHLLDTRGSLLDDDPSVTRL